MPIDVTQAQANYKGSAGIAGQRYKAKVLINTTFQPHAASETAEANYAAAVAAAAAAKRRQRALSKLSQGDWVQAASTRGATNIVTGIQAKDGKWAQNFGPYAPTIDAAVASAPPRGIGYMANRARIDAVALALEAKKRELKG